MGRAFNLGGGPANAVSLRQVIAFIGELTGRPVEARYADWRAGDQRYYVSDTRRAARELGLRPARPWREGVSALARWLREEHAAAAAQERAAEAVP
jgi:CDP-paratose 2-epimerase